MIKRPTVAERQKEWESFQAEEAKLLLNKGADYTAGKKDADAYANFRIVADLLKGAPITPYTVAMVYFLKHILSVITYTISGKQESGEGLDGRFHDIRNYAFILRELIPDHDEHFNKSIDNVTFTGPSLVDRLFVGHPLSMIDLDFPTELSEDGAQYWDNETNTWRPIRELTEAPEPQPGELESLAQDDEMNFNVTNQGL